MGINMVYHEYLFSKLKCTCMCINYDGIFLLHIFMYATKKLREMGIRCKIIFCVSSTGGTENEQEFKEAGLDEFYTKPLKVEMLSAILDKIKSC